MYLKKFEKTKQNSKRTQRLSKFPQKEKNKNKKITIKINATFVASSGESTNDLKLLRKALLSAWFESIPFLCFYHFNPKGIASPRSYLLHRQYSIILPNSQQNLLPLFPSRVGNANDSDRVREPLTIYSTR